MSLCLGFAGYFSTRICDDSPRAKELSQRFLDERWPWPLTSVVFSLREKWDKDSRRVKLSGAAGVARLLDGIVDPENREARLDHRASADQNHARLQVETGQRLAVPRWPNPAAISGICRADNLPEGTSLLPWVDLMHEIMSLLDVANAVLPVWPSVNMVDSDCTFVGVTLDTPKGDYNLGVRGNFNTQRLRANSARPQLGAQYIRHPRWGTYLRREHLDRVGGLARVRDAVPLARVLELGGPGDLVYLQCTEHPAGALTPEGEQVRQALEEVLAPIVAPPRPQELTTS